MWIAWYRSFWPFCPWNIFLCWPWTHVASSHHHKFQHLTTNFLYSKYIMLVEESWAKPLDLLLSFSAKSCWYYEAHRYDRAAVYPASSPLRAVTLPEALVVNKHVLAELVRLNKGLTRRRGGAEAAKCLTSEKCRTIGRKPLVAPVSNPMAASQVFAACKVCVLWWACYHSTSLMATNRPLATDKLLGTCFLGQAWPSGMEGMFCEDAGVPALLFLFLTFCFPCYLHSLSPPAVHPTSTPSANSCHCDKVETNRWASPKQIRWRSQS